MPSHNDATRGHSERPGSSVAATATGFAEQKFARNASPGAVSEGAAPAEPDPRRAPKRTATTNLKRAGCIGAFAVTLGVGAALTAAPGVALADSTDSDSPQSSAAGSTASDAAGDSASSQGSSARKTRDQGADDSDTAGTKNAASTRAAAASADDGEAASASTTTQRRTLSPRKPTAAVTVSPAVITPPAPGIPTAPTPNSILVATSASFARPTSARASITSSRDRTANATVSATSTAVANQNVVINAESMTVARPAYGSVFTDPTASGGTALVLTQNTTASKTVALPSFTNIVIRAKGDQYQGAPQMKVSVNGKVVAKVAVAATAWTDYTVPFKGAPGTYTVSIAYTNDRYARGKGDRNLRLDTVTVVSSVVEPAPAPAPAPTPPSSTPTPGYFGGADWLWKPISSNPTLAANSSTWVGYLAAADKQRVANLYNYSVALVSASEITSSTPRYDVTLTKAWGSDPFGSTTVPIPLGTKIPPGTDGHVAVLDPTTGQAYGIWQAKYNSSTNAWSGSWGGMTSLNGNGIDTSGSATAAAIARYAGVVTAAEFSAAIAANTGINHALAFSTDLAGPDFVYPAIKSDGQNWAGVATPIPEGYRIQLNPDINVDAIAGMTPGERVIAKTLQTHGAYVVDQGGARMAFAFELLDDATPTSPGAVWKNAGLAWDYYDMKSIPWSQLRVLAPAATPV